MGVSGTHNDQYRVLDASDSSVMLDRRSSASHSSAVSTGLQSKQFSAPSAAALDFGDVSRADFFFFESDVPVTLILSTGAGSLSIAGVRKLVLVGDAAGSGNDDLVGVAITASGTVNAKWIAAGDD